MNEKTIKIPKGMLTAFHEAENHNGNKWDDQVLDQMLEAALRWLSENPIVPTVKQAQQVWDECGRGSSFRQDFLTEWQRRMFLSAEINPVVELAKLVVQGSTLTQQEANELAAYINRCVVPRVPTRQQNSHSPNDYILRDIIGWVRLGTYDESEAMSRLRDCYGYKP